MQVKVLSLGIALFCITLASCQSGGDTKTTSSATSTAATGNFHKVVVTEVVQASEYTYLNAKEDNKDIWLAVPSIAAKAGDTYYYEGGIEMKKFESKDLHRVFETVILLEKINTEPNSNAVVKSDKGYTNPAPSGTTDNTAAAPAQDQGGATGEGYTRKPPTIEKKEVKVETAKGGITIAKLFADKASMGGKTVKVKGQVTKYTPGVMGKNWIHIQDGTDFKGKFDLTVTTSSEVKMGDVVTLEGKVALDKDLGYGYFFDVLLEDAALK